MERVGCVEKINKKLKNGAVLAVGCLLEIMCDKEEDSKLRISAAAEILNRIYGKSGMIVMEQDKKEDGILIRFSPEAGNYAD